MDILEAKRELQKIRTGNLFQMAMDQKLSRCLVGGRTCGYSLLYKGIRFCVSEVSDVPYWQVGCLSSSLSWNSKIIEALFCLLAGS